MVKHAAPRPLTLDENLMKWSALIWRCALRTGRRYGIDPDDVRSEMLVSLIRRHESYDPTFTFGTWVGLIQREVAGRIVARRRRQVRAVAIDEAIDRTSRNDKLTLADMATDRGPDPAETASRREAIERVREALAELPRGQREVVLAHFRDGLPVIQRRGHLHAFEDALSTLAVALEGCA